MPDGSPFVTSRRDFRTFHCWLTAGDCGPGEFSRRELVSVYVLGSQITSGVVFTSLPLVWLSRFERRKAFKRILELGLQLAARAVSRASSGVVGLPTGDARPKDLVNDS
jgi:hypothetical protein